MINFGEVPLGAVLPIPFATYAAATGASVTLTGLATTDIEVYKGTTVTQRASDAGYALIDTDGIDIDGITGIHGFSIDTGDNTDAGFFVAGSYYYVVVSAVTVDSQTVNFIAATFSLGATRSIAGVPEVDVTHYGGTAGTFSGGRPEVNVSHISGDSAAADNAEAFFDGTGYAGTNNVIPTVGAVSGAVGSVTGAVGSVTGNVGGNVTGSVGSVVGAVGSVTGNVGGNVAGSVASVTGLTASDVAAIKAKTDSLTFTKALELDVNMQSCNGVTVNGDGAGTPMGI